MSRAILHVDMDAFYASVEQRDNPSLRGRPLIVGGHPTRGVVLAASYEVRPFGVKSAMPMSVALKRAPAAVVVRPRFSAYVAVSEQIFSIFESFTPLVEPLSLDEAFLDVTGCERLFGAPAKIAEQIRARIAEEAQLPSSAGIASTKFVAKIASDLAKPNGQREVRAEDTVSFLSALPISRLWGVGRKAEQELRSAGIKTIGDLAQRDVAWLESRFGSNGRHFWNLSWGDDEREVVSDRMAKSIGAEDTFGEDLGGLDQLQPHVHAQSLRVGRRLRRAGLKAFVVQLKLKSSDFSLSTRRTKLAEPTDDGQEIYRVAMSLLARSVPQETIRLTGVSAQELQSNEGQLTLFDATAKQHQRLNAALDRIAEKFGSGAVGTADTLQHPEAMEENPLVRKRSI
jgi:DNA polymerase-4